MTTFIFEKRKTTPNIDTLYTVFRTNKPNYIGTIGRVRSEWIACSASGQIQYGFRTRQSAAEFLSALCGPFKSEIKAALKQLEQELTSPQMQALLAEEI